MATETMEVKREDETLSPLEQNDEVYAHPAASNSTSSEGFDDATLAEGGVTQRDSFMTSTEPAEQLVEERFILSAELPELAGADVDCRARSVKSQENAPTTPACDTSSPAPGAWRGGRRRTMRPEDKNCSCCKTQFQRHGRSFNRRAVYTFTTPDTVQWAFPDATVHQKSFLCETCAQSIRSKCKRKQSGKRSLWLKPAVSKQSEVEDGRMKRMGKKSRAALLVNKSCYKAAFRVLWSAKGARRPMMDFWSKQLREEMKVLRRQPDNPFHQKVSSQKPLSSFPWRRCLSWAQLKAPLVTTCLTSLFPNMSGLSRSSHSQMTEEQAQMLLECRTVVALSIPLFTRNIWKNNFLQASLGAELRLQGCSGAALDVLNTMGLCQNKDTVRLLLHRLHNSQSATDDGQHSMKTTADYRKGEQTSAVEEEEECGDVEDEEEDVDTTEEEGEGGGVQDEVDQEDPGLGRNAETDQSLKEAGEKQKEERSKQKSEVEDGRMKRMGKKSRAALLVNKSCYKAAFRVLWSAKGARRPMMDFWSKQLREEMKVLRRQPDNPFHQKVSSQKPLSSFPWRRCLSWAQVKAPLVTTCLTSLFPNMSGLSRSSHSQMTEEQAQMLLECRTVVALSIPLFTRNIWKNNFLQASLGAELRLQGCSGAALDALNTMGLCQNKDTVRLLLHRLHNSQSATDDGQHSMKTTADYRKGEQTSAVEEEEECGDVEDEEEDVDTTEEEGEGEGGVQDEVDQEDPGLGRNAETDQSLKEAGEKQKEERSKQKVRQEEEEEEGRKRRRVVVVRLDLLKGHSEVGPSDLSASDLP